MDELLRHHNAFLDLCLKECLLTNQHLLKLLRKIMSLCLLFSQNIERFTSSVKVDQDNPGDTLVRRRAAPGTDPITARRKRLAVEASHIQKIVSHPNYVKMVSRFVENFDEKVGQFIRHLAEKYSSASHSHLANLYTRLDYNSYYSTRYHIKDLIKP